MDSVGVKFSGCDLQIFFAGDFANFSRSTGWPLRTYAQRQRDDCLWRLHRNCSAIFETCRNKDAPIVQGDEIGFKNAPSRRLTSLNKSFPPTFSKPSIRSVDTTGSAAGSCVKLYSQVVPTAVGSSGSPCATADSDRNTQVEISRFTNGT